MQFLQSKKIAIVLTLVSGILSGVCVIVPQIWPVVFFALAPFFVVLFSPATHSRKEAALYGGVFGFVANLVINVNAFPVYPLSWLGITNHVVGISIIGVSWILCSVFMGVAPFLFSILFFEFKTRVKNTLAQVLYAAIFWIVTEPIRFFMFSLFMLGSTSTLEFGFTVGSLGYTFGYASDPFWFALARWGGVALLSFSAALVSAGLASAFLSYQDKKTFRWRVLGVAIVVSTFFIASTIASNSAENARGQAPSWHDADKITVVAVQTNFPAVLSPTKTDNAARNAVGVDVAKSVAALGIKPDVLLLPESIGANTDADSYQAISKVLPQGTLVVHSKYPHDDVVPTVQEWAHTIGGDTRISDKEFIFPYGEYPPYLLAIPVKFFAPNLYREIEKSRLYRGGSTLTMGEAKNVAVGVRICFEVFSATLYTKLAQAGAGILVHSSSLAMFHGSPLIGSEMRAAARIRAVENGLPIVQAINGTRGTAFDCRGKEIMPIATDTDFNVYDLTSYDTCVGL